MSRKNSQIDPERFTQLLEDFTTELGIDTFDLDVELDSKDEYCLRKDFRYRKNKSLPFFLIKLYERSTALIIDTLGGSKIYEWHDDETYEALHPLIIKTLKKSFGELQGQIVHDAVSGSTVVVRPSTFDEEETLLYLQCDDGSYSATLKDGKILLSINASAEIVAEYIDAVKQHLVPKAQEVSDA